MAVRKKTPAERAPVDTVALKKRIATSERNETVNRTLQQQNEARAAAQRKKLGRSSVGETIASQDAKHFGHAALGARIRGDAQRDTLEQERANAATDRAKRAALRPVRLGSDATKAKPRGRPASEDTVAESVGEPTGLMMKHTTRTAPLPKKKR